MSNSKIHADKVRSLLLQYGGSPSRTPSVDEWGDTISDFMADMRHLALEEGIDWNDMLRRCDNHFEAETLFQCFKCGARFGEEDSDEKFVCEDCDRLIHEEQGKRALQGARRVLSGEVVRGKH